MNGKQLKNSILQWAIQGKLVPQDPNDEPASVLLERIRAEKARLVKEKKIKKDKNESIIYRGDDNSYYEQRIEAAYFEAVRTLLTRVEAKGKISFREINGRINELLKQSIKSEGVINLFSDIKEEFSLFDSKFLEEVARMKERNFAVELLRRLIAEQVQLYQRTNTVRAEKFSEILADAMSRYLKGMLTNEEVIEELLKIAREIVHGEKAGKSLNLNSEELAFYDALTKPEAVKDFYSNDQLVAITRELTDALRRNKTIDWNMKESARAGMRRIVKRLLKKYNYPPAGQEDALNTIMEQCKKWNENN